MRKSNSHNVTIRGVTRNHTGLYQCEVSADAPLFHTLHKSAQMQVAVMPQMEPTMNVYGVATGEDNKRHINYGDHLKASCIAGPSSPTVNFTWRVNDVVFPVGGSVASSLYFIIQLPAAITLSWMDKVVVRCVWGCTAELPEACVHTSPPFFTFSRFRPFLFNSIRSRQRTATGNAVQCLARTGSRKRPGQSSCLPWTMLCSLDSPSPPPTRCTVYRVAVVVVWEDYWDRVDSTDTTTIIIIR